MEVLDTVSYSDLSSAVFDVIPYGVFQQADSKFILEQLRPEDWNLGDGDLFADHQLAPLGAVMYAVGVTKISRPMELYSFCGRMEQWGGIPHERKMYELFGKATGMRICQLLTKLVEKGWQFSVSNLDATDPVEIQTGYIQPMDETEFQNLILTKGVPT
jgi:hypothetical protein